MTRTADPTAARPCLAFPVMNEHSSPARGLGTIVRHRGGPHQRNRAARLVPLLPLVELLAIGLGIAVLWALTAGWKEAKIDLRS